MSWLQRKHMDGYNLMFRGKKDFDFRRIKILFLPLTIRKSQLNLGTLAHNTSLEKMMVILFPERKQILNFQTHFSFSDGICVVLPLHARDIGRKDIFFGIPGFHKKNVRVVDGQMSTYNMLNPDTLFGEPIREERGVRNTYRISFEEVHWLKEGGECTVYGDQARFKTFADCVANTYEQMFKPVLGCNIPLLSAPGNTDNCKGRIKLNGSRASEYGAKTFALIDKKLSSYNRYNELLKTLP